MRFYKDIIVVTGWDFFESVAKKIGRRACLGKENQTNREETNTRRERAGYKAPPTVAFAVTRDDDNILRADDGGKKETKELNYLS